VILDRLAARESHTAIVKPTRYGKRDLIILAAYEAEQNKLLSGSMVLTPALHVTENFTDSIKLGETIQRYRLPPVTMNRVRRLRGFSEHQPFANGEFLLATTMQLCVWTPVKDIIDLFDARAQAIGQPMAIFIDECHFIAHRQRWGQILAQISMVGVPLILLTATPSRADGDVILGFRWHTEREMTEDRYRRGPIIGETQYTERVRGVRVTGHLIADDTTTFREAWAEKPAVLCQLHRETITVETPDGPLHELSESHTKEHLHRILRSPQFLEPAVSKVLERLRDVQTINPTLKAMIVTGNDQVNDTRDNEHAMRIRELIHNRAFAVMGRTVGVEIITLKTEEDEPASQKLRTFFDGPKDIVIVKQMGTVGLDDGRLKVLGYFSPIRTEAALIQAWMRPTTPYERLYVAYLILPDDRLLEAVWQRLKAEGGEANDAQLGDMDFWTETVVVDAFPSQSRDIPERPPGELTPGYLSGFDDSEGYVGPLPYYQAAGDFMMKFPESGRFYTPAQIATWLEGSGLVMPGPVPATRSWGLEQQIRLARRNVVEAAKDKATAWMRARLGTTEYRADVFRVMVTTIHITANRRAQIPRGYKLEQITNLATLTRLREIIESLPATPPEA
jgi:hypothetical protein